MIELLHIGKTFKTHGIKGEIEIEVEEIFLDWLLKTKIFFLKMDGNPVPYWIESIRTDSRIFIKIEDIDSPEVAKLLTHKEIYIDKTRVPKDLLEEHNQDLSHIGFEGFQLIDINSGVAAMILQVIEYPSQLMVEVEFKNRKLMLPLHEDFIKTLDQKNKTIKVSLPDGIFEI
ncbi:MAG: hypothetical protein IT267_07310 [Saprospiraceae bacterium]|nr:hypothetical protein [Saprospiraceae bacterium]